MSISADNPTLLKLWGIGVMPYSARGLKQTFEPIDAQQHLERTINGELIDLGYEPFQKYKSSISGADQRPPAFDGVWAGRIVEVECIQELCTSDYGSLSRTVVEGSLRQEAGFTFYRPRLTMRVMNFSMEEDEWARGVTWRLDLEEI